MSKEFFLPEVEELSLTLGTMDGANVGSGHTDTSPTPPPDDKTVHNEGQAYITNNDSGSLSELSIRYNDLNDLKGKTSLTMDIDFIPGAVSQGITDIRVDGVPAGMSYTMVKISDTKFKLYCYAQNGIPNLGSCDFRFTAYFDNSNAFVMDGATKKMLVSFDANRNQDKPLPPGGEYVGSRFNIKLEGK